MGQSHGQSRHLLQVDHGLEYFNYTYSYDASKFWDSLPEKYS